MRKPAAPVRSCLGLRAELAVADYLVAHGFVILNRNLRLGALELDIVARHRELVAVVEVRTRAPGSFEGPFASIGPAKRKRLVRAVERLWGERFAAMSAVERIRIDAAAVAFEAGQTRVEYVEGALGG
jgi:putative endonuclease